MRSKIFITTVVLCLVTSLFVAYMITGCSKNSPSGIAALKSKKQVDTQKEYALQNKPVEEPEGLSPDKEDLDKLREKIPNALSWVPSDQDAQNREPLIETGVKYNDSLLPGQSTSTPTSSESSTYTPQWSRETGNSPDSSDFTLNYPAPSTTPPITPQQPSGMGGGMRGGGGFGGGGRGAAGGFGGTARGGRGGAGGPSYGRNRPITGTDGTSYTLIPVPEKKWIISRAPGLVGRPGLPGTPVELLNFSADEIWVIAKVDTSRRSVSDDVPGTGSMLARLPNQEKEIPLPLKHTDVKGDISGYIATVEVIQQFQNPYSEKIEASYVFPLPQDAAVNEFIMVIGDRKIRGIIREREEAEQIYQEARSQGYVASLLTQERPNIFTQKVANIEPKKQIDVNIKYFNTLAYVDGWYEFVFPMVVGPRYNPPGSTDGVGAVAFGKPGVSGQSTEVQYLKPNQRSGHDISLAVNINAGVEIEEVKCPSHVITKSNLKENNLLVKLSDSDNIPNKDFVLRYRVAGKKVKSALVTHKDQARRIFHSNALST